MAVPEMPTAARPCRLEVLALSEEAGVEQRAAADLDDLTAFPTRPGQRLRRRLILAAAATPIARRPGRPPRLILLLPGFFTLTVGSLGMRGLTTPTGGYVIEGFADLMKPVTIVTAIALGLVAGAALTQNLSAGGPAPVPATTPPDEPVHEATP